MGLSIYYNGKLNSPSSLPLLIEEVKDICEAHTWKYHVFNTAFMGNKFKKRTDDMDYGITFSPPKCEPICLCFSSNSQLITPWFREFAVKGEKEKGDKYYGAFTKTQYAGVEIHKIIIDLLRHISKKYFKEFKLIDESKYWESKSEKVLYANFQRYDNLMENFALGLDAIPKTKSESVEKYLIRVMERIHAQEKKK